MRTNKRINLALSAFLGLALLSGLGFIVGATRSQANGSGLLWLNPSSATVGIGQNQDLIMQLDTATNVYGIDVALSFDPAVLAVVDADAGEAGVQIAVGACPAPDFVLTNDADNVAGSIEYVVTQLAPTTACDGGTIGTITVQCLKEGQSTVAYTSSMVVDPDGWVIAHTTQSSDVTCSSNYGVYLPAVMRRH